MNRKEALEYIQLTYDGKLPDDNDDPEVSPGIVASKTLGKFLFEKEKRYVHSIIDLDMKLIDAVFYKNKDEIGNEFTVEKLLQRYHYYKDLADRGSQVAASIVIDIEQAIKFTNFTAKEEKIIRMWMQGYTQTEIAEAVYDYQPNVNKAINKCIDRLRYILVYLNPYS